MPFVLPLSMSAWARARLEALIEPKVSLNVVRSCLVGDPKQARDCIRAKSPDDVISVSTNFRSCRSILAFVDNRFREVLQVEGKPGYVALDPFHEGHDRGPCVAALGHPGGGGGCRC